MLASAGASASCTYYYWSSGSGTPIKAGSPDRACTVNGLTRSASPPGNGYGYCKNTSGSLVGLAISSGIKSGSGGYMESGDVCSSTVTGPTGSTWNADNQAWECTTAGYVVSGGACVEPTCDGPENLGKVWNGTACAYPETPDCGEGDIKVVSSAGVVLGCYLPDNPDNPDECDYSLGYGSDGYFLCSDQKAECEAAGGTHGYIDGEEVCVPDDYSPPTCDPAQAVVMSEGGFVCSTPQPVKPQTGTQEPGEGPEPPPPGPTTPTGESDEGEGHTGTPETGKTGEAKSSGNCAVPPVCSGGDKQACAILRQQWETMCHSPDITEEVDGNQAGVITQTLETGIDSVFTGTTAESVVGTVAVDPTGGVGSATEITWFQGFVTGLIPSGTSCSSYSMNLPRVTLVFGCERLNWLKQFLGWVLYVYTVYMVWGTVFAPYRAGGNG